MDNRTLLERAATAIEIALRPFTVRRVDGTDEFIGYQTNPDEWPRGWFNPLEDDGDALRLGVALRMSMHFESQFFLGEPHRIVEVFYAHDESGGCKCESEGYTDDPMSAVRLCIVRAAAAMAEEV